MSSIEIPETVADAVCTRWPQVGPRWVEGTLKELRQLCDRYRAFPVQVLTARYGFVVAVSSGDSTDLVFRSTPDPAGTTQASVAAALSRLDVGPYLHEVVSTDIGTWTIMDRIQPGIPLSIADLSKITPEAITAPFRTMVGQAAPGDLPTVFDWLRDRLLDDELADISPGRRQASFVERQTAIAALDDLARASDRQEICHGDTSPGNILIAAGNQVRLIDPRGVSGEVAYDLAVFALKVGRHDQSKALTFADWLAFRVGVDSTRVRSWVAIADAARV